MKTRTIVVGDVLEIIYKNETIVFLILDVIDRNCFALGTDGNHYVYFKQYADGLYWSNKPIVHLNYFDQCDSWKVIL